MDPKLEAWFAEERPWQAVSDRLRANLVDCGLDEAFKWRKPCYVHDGHNIAIIQEMKGFVALMFFKGALLDDPHGVLESQGENTRSAMRVCFRSVEDVNERAAAVRALVREAIEAERTGRALPERGELVLVDELRARLDADPALKAAFDGLTPGRQRGYDLYVSGAKQAKTRRARVEKCAPKILAGKGLRDR